MISLCIAALTLAASGTFTAQGIATATSPAQLPSHATIPVTFTKTVSAAHAQPGDPVEARTTQALYLNDGRSVPSGALVRGHVLISSAFRYDRTPYAKQSPGNLEVQIDSLEALGQTLPLHVVLRAMADPFASMEAYQAKSTDMDSLGTTTQVGGDLLVPSQSEIRNRDGDVVGYNKKGGQFAHLIANARGSVTCDAGDTEQPVSRFSASACGLYGFGQFSLTSFAGSHIGLTSTHGSPEIRKDSTALLEVAPEETAR